MSNSSHTYDHMDMESLLLTKEYNELSSEERDFVNEQVDSPTQYQDMRMALLAVVSTKETETITPSANTKAALMDQFNRAHQSTTTTKSSWFSFNNMGFRYSLVGSLAVGLILYFTVFNNEEAPEAPVYTENQIETIEKEPITVQVDSIKTVVMPETDETIAYNDVTTGTYDVIVTDENGASGTFASPDLNGLESNAVISNGFTSNNATILNSPEPTISGTIAQGPPLYYNGPSTGNAIRDNSNNDYYTINMADSTSAVIANDDGGANLQPQSYGFTSNMVQRDFAGNYKVPATDTVALMAQSASGDFNFGESVTPALAPKNFAKTIDLLKMIQTATDK